MPRDKRDLSPDGAGERHHGNYANLGTIEIREFASCATHRRELLRFPVSIASLGICDLRADVEAAVNVAC